MISFSLITSYSFLSFLGCIVDEVVFFLSCFGFSLEWIIDFNTLHLVPTIHTSRYQESFQYIYIYITEVESYQERAQ